MSLKALALSAIIVVLPNAVTAAEDRREEKIGPWNVITISDPITDESRTLGILNEGAAFMGIKCDSPGANSVYIQYRAAEFLGSNMPRTYGRETLYRFDQDPPVTQRWSYSDVSAILTDGRAVAQFVGRLSTAKRVVIRATTYRHAEVTKLFPLDDPEETKRVIQRVYEGCKAGPPPAPIAPPVPITAPAP